MNECDDQRHPAVKSVRGQHSPACCQYQHIPLQPEFTEARADIRAASSSDWHQSALQATWDAQQLADFARQSSVSSVLPLWPPNSSDGSSPLLPVNTSSVRLCLSTTTPLAHRIIAGTHFWGPVSN